MKKHKVGDMVWYMDGRGIVGNFVIKGFGYHQGRLSLIGDTDDDEIKIGKEQVFKSEDECRAYYEAKRVNR
jgi:hypothetical protein